MLEDMGYLEGIVGNVIDVDDGLVGMGCDEGLEEGFLEVVVVFG
nr:hypothetical protein [Paenibacillus bovis]